MSAPAPAIADPTSAAPLSRPAVLPPGHPPARPLRAAWFGAGLRRCWGSALVCLVCAWSGVWLAVWLLVAESLLGALFSAIGSAIGAAISGGASGASPGSGALSVAGGALEGAATGLVTSVADLVVREPVQFVAAITGGLLVSLLLLGLTVGLEPWLLRLRGFRRMSRRESERILPLLGSAAALLGLDSLPFVLMADGDDLRVRAQVRHLVVGRSLLEELGAGPAGDAALEAVLCHGLHHWAAGDGVGLRFVRCCGLPLVLLYDAGCWLAQQGNSLIALVGWVVLWPAWLLVRLVIQPVVAAGSRRREYEADAAVRTAGRGAALHRALSLLGELEPGKSAWGRVIAATHPPRELRLEALEPDAPG